MLLHAVVKEPAGLMELVHAILDSRVLLAKLLIVLIMYPATIREPASLKEQPKELVSAIHFSRKMIVTHLHALMIIQVIY